MSLVGIYSLRENISVSQEYAGNCYHASPSQNRITYLYDCVILLSCIHLNSKFFKQINISTIAETVCTENQ